MNEKRTVVVVAGKLHRLKTGEVPDPAPFLVSRNLAEIASDAASQEEAQNNLGLGGVDPLAFYILAKF